MTEAEKLDLLASCVAFAVANLRLPLGVQREPVLTDNWRKDFLSVLKTCGYGKPIKPVTQEAAVVVEGAFGKLNKM